MNAVGIRFSSHQTCAAYIGLLVGVGAISVVDMPAMFWPGDPMIWRLEAHSILNGGLAIDRSQLPSSIEPGQAIVHNPRNGNWYSKYGLMNSLMSLPPAALDRLSGDAIDPLLIYNLWNALLTVSLAAVLMRLSGRYARRTLTRILFVLATLYGTFLWYYLRAQGSEIYQTLFVSLTYLFLVEGLPDARTPDRPGSKWKLAAAWACVGALVLMRVVNLLLLLLVAMAILAAILRFDPSRRRNVFRSLAPYLMIPPLLVLIVLGSVNFIKFGSPFLSGYHQWNPNIDGFRGRWLDGLLGFLIQPRFNIFLYFPPLLFALLQLRPFARRYPIDFLFAFGTGILFLLVISRLPFWAGEWTYGPRYLLPFLPIMSLPFILLVDRLIDSRKSIAMAMLSIAIGVAMLYSAFLQFRTNQVDFFFYYFVRESIDSPRWNELQNARFWERHAGLVTHQLLSNRDTPERMPWFQELNSRWPAPGLAAFQKFINSYIDRGNHYWWRPEPPKAE